MEKSNEECLADIENSITRLTKMQGCAFRLLSVLRKTVHLFEARVAALTLITVSLEAYRQHGNRFLAFTFGAITVFGGSASLLALYFATEDPTFIRMSTVLFVLFFVLLILAVLEYRQMNSLLREAKKETILAKEITDAAKEEGVSLDEELAQVLAAWKKLVPDDLVSEHKPED
jgi:predicted signal transduction protein with EAL and GGDEF domain